MIEEVIEDFEQQLKDAVSEENEGKRKCEASWKIHRIHWEKNRFIYDLMYVRKVMSRELVSLEPRWRGWWVLCGNVAAAVAGHYARDMLMRCVCSCVAKAAIISHWGKVQWMYSMHTKCRQLPAGTTCSDPILSIDWGHWVK